MTSSEAWVTVAVASDLLFVVGGPVPSTVLRSRTVDTWSLVHTVSMVLCSSASLAQHEQDE